MDIDRMKQQLLLAMHIFVVVSAVLVLGQFSPWLWNRRCMVCFIAVNAHRTFERRGAHFQLSNAFLTSIMAEDSFHYVIYGVIFYGEQPSSVSIFVPAIYSFFKMLLGAAKLYPSVEPRIGNFIKGKAGEKQADGTVTTTRSDQAFQFVARMEIGLFLLMWSRAVMSIGMRSLMAAFMYSQFTMLRYTSVRNPRPRNAWSGMRGFVTNLGASRYCPQVLARGINWGLDKIDQTLATVQAQAQAYAQRQANQAQPPEQ